MISHFFIDRPIFATVLSIVITLAGGLAVVSLPIAQYPPISPPQVQVAINYPGASAQVVADTVAAPIEQQVNGVPGMLYMTSLSGNNGTYTLFVTFQVGTDLNTALVMVQNRVQLAIPLLPTSVQNQGITIRKKTPDVLMVISVYSPNDRYDGLYLSNYSTINLYDPLLRVDGVSDITVLGEPQYSIRGWLDPQKLSSLGMNAGDVAKAVANQNIEVAAGRVGQSPSGKRQAFDLPIDTLGRLTDPEQFGDIIVKVGSSTPIELADEGRRVAKAGFAPRIVAEGALLDFQQAAPRGHADLALGAIKLEWGLFEGGKRVAELRISDSKIRASMAEAEAIADTIAFQVTESYRNLMTARRAIDLSRPAVSQAEENHRLVQARNKVGDATPAEITDAESTLTRAQQAYYNSIHDYLIAQARLEYAMGVVPPGATGGREQRHRHFAH